MIDPSPDRGRRTAGSAARHALLLSMMAAAIGACGMIPSEPPKFEEKYIVEAMTLALSAADLAPEEVSLKADSSAFLVVSDSTFFQRDLGQMCAACVALNGATAPKPAFTTTFSSSVPVAPSLISANVTSGTIDIIIYNQLSFDPVRPSATARGTIDLVVRRGTTTVASFTINGTAIAFPPGTALGGLIPVSAFNLNGPLTIDVTVNSPAGDNITVNTSEYVAAWVGPVRAEVSQVTVSVASGSFSDTARLDLTGASSDLGDKIQDGGFRFAITNPFNASATFQLQVLQGTTTLLTRTLNVPPGATSTNSIDLTVSEIRSLLGKDLRTVISGSLSVPGGQLTLTPQQVMTIVTFLDLTIFPLGD